MSPFKVPNNEAELPEGQFEVEIIAVADRSPSKNGHPQFVLTLQASDGRTHDAWVVAAPKARFKLEEIWHAAGLTLPVSGEVDENDLLTHNVHITLGRDDYGLKVQEWAPPVQSEIPSDTPANGGGQSTFAAAAGQKGSAPADDDIPFAASVI